MASGDRQARLSALVAAATDWATQRTQLLNNQLDTLKAIMQGRQGSEQLAQTAQDATSDLVVTSIDDFLSG